VEGDIEEVGYVVGKALGLGLAPQPLVVVFQSGSNAPQNQRGALRGPSSLPAYCPGFNTDSCMRPGRSGRGTLLEAVGLGERKRSLCGPERKFRAELSEGSHRRFRHSPRTWAFIRVALEWSKPISESIYESTALAPRPSRGYTSLLELLMVECLRTYSPALALVHLYPPPLHRVEGVRCTLLHTGFREGYF
jgi:hypothetical protein